MENGKGIHVLYTQEIFAFVDRFHWSFPLLEDWIERYDSKWTRVRYDIQRSEHARIKICGKCDWLTIVVSDYKVWSNNKKEGSLDLCPRSTFELKIFFPKSQNESFFDNTYIHVHLDNVLYTLLYCTFGISFRKLLRIIPRDK